MKTIETLNGMRALATMGIFLFHAGFLLYGTFPVTLFFMLSGFFMFYTKHESIKWSTGIKQFKKFYPLHIITFLISLFVGKVWMGFGYETVKSAFLNLFLIQTWFEKYALTFNALSWYLSVTLFLYSISYPIVTAIKKIQHPFRWSFIIILLIFGANNCILLSDIDLYINPLYRVLDFTLGMILAKIYLLNSFTLEKSKSTMLEIFLVVIFCIQYIAPFVLKFKPDPGYYSVLFAAAILIFANGTGLISQLLSTPFFQVISKYSFPFYMFHELALRIFRRIFEAFEFNYLLKCIIIAIPALILTILCVLIYSYISKKLKYKVV